MKKLLFLFLSPLLLFSNHVHWQGVYDKALAQAREENKSLLVLVVKNKEPLCNEIIKNIFMNQPYIKKINREIIAVIVRYEGKVSYPIELYYTTIFPTLFLVDAQKETFLNKPLYGEDICVNKVKEILR